MQVMKRVIAASIFFCLFASVGSAQNISELHRKIQKAIDEMEYSVAVSELENLMLSDRRTFVLNNYDYLLGRLAERTRDFSSAMANYQNVAGQNSPLKEYALFHIAQIAHTTG